VGGDALQAGGAERPPDAVDLVSDAALDDE
jgi:hypothetical protein